MGPAAYDVASLLQDARVDVPEDTGGRAAGRYARVRRDRRPAFRHGGFARLYATLAAQRATKILGIFARLDRRDGKPQYLRHMPRVWAYLQRSLAHPALAPLRAWYVANVRLPGWAIIARNRVERDGVAGETMMPKRGDGAGGGAWHADAARTTATSRNRWSGSAARR